MSRAILPACLAPLAVVAAAIGGGRLLLPILATLALYPVLARLLLEGRPKTAVVAALLWAAVFSASIIVFASRAPDRAGELVIRGPAYREEMFAFLRTGVGREGDPARYLPQHAAHLAAFVALCVASGGVLGILLGAIMVGYMSYYVGALAAAGGSPWTAYLLGWPPYAVLRVVAFIILGVLLSRPLLARVAGRPIPFPRARLWYAAAAFLLLADVALKALVAPAWAALLRPCLGGSP
jgi:hypothetical protein